MIATDLARLIDTRISDVERAGVRYRQGVVAAISPLTVKLGGSDVAVQATALESAGPLVVNDVVAVLSFDADLLVIGTIAGPPVTVNGSSTAAEGPSGLGTDLTYTQITVALTPGKWLMYGQATLVNGSAQDGMQLALWNNTAGSEIADTSGPVAIPPATGGIVHVTTTAIVTVTSNIDVRLRGKRNGGSTVTFGYGGGTLAGEQRITGVRL